MHPAEKAVSGLATSLAVAGLSLLLLFAAFTMADGLLRAIANHPLDIVREIGDLVAAICGACCLPIVLLQQGNITLRPFEKVLPASAVRVIDILAAAIVEIVLVAMAWEFLMYAFKTMRAGEVTWLLAWPKAPFWFVVNAVVWVAVIVQLVVLIRSAKGLPPHRPTELAP